MAFASSKLSPKSAVIAPEKLRDYILSPTHPDGKAKADYLAQIGYSQEAWKQLEKDLRSQHLLLDAKPGRVTPWGRKYEILGPLTGPSGNDSLDPHDLDSPTWRIGGPADHTDTGEEAMTSPSFERVVLLRDLPAEGLRAGDVGTIVERYPASEETQAGFEVEFFAANGETVAVASVSADAVRPATERDLLSSRVLTPA